MGRVVSIDEVQVWSPRGPRTVTRPRWSVWFWGGQRWWRCIPGTCTAPAGRGLVTGWASRLEGRYPAILERPAVIGSDLVEVVEGLLALPAAPLGATQAGGRPREPNQDRGSLVTA